MIFERDPEEVGPEHPDDLDARMRASESIHDFVLGDNNLCSAQLRRRDGSLYTCNAEKWSVLHNDEEADFRERHDHGGGDCMCFEMAYEEYG